METKKISLIGTAGVGKSTLMKMISGQDIPINHDPTIAVDFQDLKFKDFNISMWELGGQKQFQFMWDDFIKGSSLICVISDSTQKNLQETKEIIAKFKNLQSQMLVIANKQDKSDAVSPTEIQKVLGIETIGMIAIDRTKKRTLLKILEEKMSFK